MAIYVDDARIPAQVGRHSGRWSHLTADTKAELHEFARRIGLRQDWFQDKGNHRWHYDVTDSMRARAIAHGAQAVSYFRDMPQILRTPGREGMENPGGAR
jgi:hypothetical protein